MPSSITSEIRPYYILLYRIAWQSIKIGRGYFPHGIRLCERGHPLEQWLYVRDDLFMNACGRLGCIDYFDTLRVGGGQGEEGLTQTSMKLLRSEIKTGRMLTLAALLLSVVYASRDLRRLQIEKVSE